MSSKVICIAGMHRTGSSLFSSWLLSCGLHIGTDTIGGSYGNPFGHFEDKDFVKFHKKVLNRRGLTHLLEKPIKMKFEPSEKEEALAIINNKSDNYAEWAWKDPRTSLFINEWRNLIHDLKIIVLIRPPERVIDSLIRREFHFYKNQKGWKWLVLYMWSLWKKATNLNRKRKLFCQTYLAYYQNILDYLKSSKLGKEFLVVDIDLVLERDMQIANFVRKQWGFTINYQPFHKVYDQKVFKTSNQSNYKLDNEWSRKLNQTYDDLMAFCVSTKQLIDE